MKEIPFIVSSWCTHKIMKKNIIFLRLNVQTSDKTSQPPGLDPTERYSVPTLLRERGVLTTHVRQRSLFPTVHGGFMGKFPELWEDPEIR